VPQARKDSPTMPRVRGGRFLKDLRKLVSEGRGIERCGQRGGSWREEGNRIGENGREGFKVNEG
jgi:hypothetical protein